MDRKFTSRRNFLKKLGFGAAGAAVAVAAKVPGLIAEEKDGIPHIIPYSYPDPLLENGTGEWSEPLDTKKLVSLMKTVMRRQEAIPPRIEFNYDDLYISPEALEDIRAHIDGCSITEENKKKIMAYEAQDGGVIGLPIGTVHDGDDSLRISTLEGQMSVSIGDWVIQGVEGELYPCKPDIFEKTYEEVEK